MISVPSFSDPIEEHADWVEYRSMVSTAGFYSWSDYKRDQRLMVSADEADDQVDIDEEPFERLIDDVCREISARVTACGGAQIYPFYLESHGLQSLGRGVNYRFMLLLTLMGHKAGPPRRDGAKLFEDLCALALETYLGHPGRPVESLVFGFPRRIEAKAFPAAVDHLCECIREGRGHRPAERAHEMKDAGLDVVAWHHFPDRGMGKLIVFGQCSTGEDWHTKLRQADPFDWCRLWMIDIPAPIPVPAFLSPRRIPTKLWEEAAVKGGLIFDRCRIAWLSTLVSGDLRDRLASWADFVLRRISGGRFAA